jgi:DNA-binding GntR family transcriptional regulator
MMLVDISYWFDILHRRYYASIIGFVSKDIEQQMTKPPALKDWAYNKIKEDILDLRVPPGSKLPVNRLANELGISRTPIREALNQLHCEGLVLVESRVGFFVAPMVKQDLEDLFEIRILLESYAAQKTALSITENDLSHLEELNNACLRAIEMGSEDSFLKVDISLHGLIISRAGNPRLLSFIQDIEDLTHRELSLGVRSIENVRASISEHQHLLEALRQRDSELASKAMYEHLCNVKERVIKILDDTDFSE